MQRALAVGAVILALSAAACGSGDDHGKTLPPRTKAAIAAPFRRDLADLGLQVTRAAVVDPETGEPAPGATHLAVYVEPTGAYSPADFADGLVTVSRVFLPAVFERWPGLTSFDVCQEPLPGVDDSEAPPPKTQIAVSREEVERFDWARSDLRTMLEHALAVDDPDAFRVYADDEVARSPIFVRAAPPGGASSAAGDVSY